MILYELYICFGNLESNEVIHLLACLAMLLLAKLPGTIDVPGSWVLGEGWLPPPRNWCIG